MVFSLWSTLTVMLLQIPQSGVSPGVAPFHGRLYGVVSRLEPSDLDALRDVSGAPAAARARLTQFVDCARTFRSRRASSQGFFNESARPHQDVLERALACAGGASLAADYVAHATILYEWEGLHTSPLEEAAYAERFLHEHSDSPLAPMLHLFVAARMRYAFELLDGSLADAEMVSLAQRYHSALQRARADALTALISADLDGLSFVYRDTRKHPRDAVRR